MELCAWLTITPDLTRDAYPTPYLKMFSGRFRVGVLESNITGVNKSTMGGYLCNVVHIFSGMGITTHTYITWAASTFISSDNSMRKNVTTHPLSTCNQ